jgi:hypothetical protein
VLAFFAPLVGCGGDDGTETVTVTTSAPDETQPPPTGPAVVELQQVMTGLGSTCRSRRFA